MYADMITVLCSLACVGILGVAYTCEEQERQPPSPRRHEPERTGGLPERAVVTEEEKEPPSPPPYNALRM